MRFGQVGSWVALAFLTSTVGACGGGGTGGQGGNGGHAGSGNAGTTGSAGTTGTAGTTGAAGGGGGRGGSSGTGGAGATGGAGGAVGTPLTGVLAVSVGSGSACAVATGGRVECWGNTIGGSNIIGAPSLPTANPVAAPVTGLASGVTTLSVGGAAACAVTAGGGVECWGLLTNTLAPVQVTGLTSGVTGVSVGQGLGVFQSAAPSACALTAGGGVMCWDTRSTVPSTVTGLTSGVTAISVGTSACAITAGGGVTCWGPVGFINPSPPSPVTGLASGVTAVSAGGGFNCALTVGGSVMCWGQNASGQLGNNSTTSSTTPVQVTGLTSGVTAVSAGVDAACALTAGGGVMCWGGNISGQLGNNSTTGSLVPVQVVGLTSGVTAVSMGNQSACALTAGGGVMCWGNNQYGGLGNNSATSSSVPVPVVGK